MSSGALVVTGRGWHRTKGEDVVLGQDPREKREAARVTEPGTTIAHEAVWGICVFLQDASAHASYSAFCTWSFIFLGPFR